MAPGMVEEGAVPGEATQLGMLSEGPPSNSKEEEAMAPGTAEEEGAAVTSLKPPALGAMVASETVAPVAIQPEEPLGGTPRKPATAAPRVARVALT
jgi:hypothetical protein